MTDDELIEWVARGYEEIEQKPVDWHQGGGARKITQGTVVMIERRGIAHDQFLRSWGNPSEQRRLKKLGFDLIRPEGRWLVTFVQPVDSEAHAYFPEPPPEEGNEPPSTQEAVLAFVGMDKECETSEIIEALARQGYESDLIAQKIEKLVNEGSLKRLPNGRIKDTSPF